MKERGTIFNIARLDFLSVISKGVPISCLWFIYIFWGQVIGMYSMHTTRTFAFARVQKTLYRVSTTANVDDVWHFYLNFGENLVRISLSVEHVSTRVVVSYLFRITICLVYMLSTSHVYSPGWMSTALDWRIFARYNGSNPSLLNGSFEKDVILRAIDVRKRFKIVVC